MCVFVLCVFSLAFSFVCFFFAFQYFFVTFCFWIFSLPPKKAKTEENTRQKKNKKIIAHIFCASYFAVMPCRRCYTTFALEILLSGDLAMPCHAMPHTLTHSLWNENSTHFHFHLVMLFHLSFVLQQKCFSHLTVWRWCIHGLCTRCFFFFFFISLLLLRFYFYFIFFFLFSLCLFHLVRVCVCLCVQMNARWAFEM